MEETIKVFFVFKTSAPLRQHHRDWTVPFTQYVRYNLMINNKYIDLYIKLSLWLHFLNYSFAIYSF